MTLKSFSIGQYPLLAALGGPNKLLIVFIYYPNEGRVIAPGAIFRLDISVS